MMVGSNSGHLHSLGRRRNQSCTLKNKGPAIAGPVSWRILGESSQISHTSLFYLDLLRFNFNEKHHLSILNGHINGITG